MFLSVKDLPPAIGTLTAWGLFLSVVPCTLQARREGRLTADPTPFPLTLVNCLLWIVYAAALGDMWIIAGNLVGVLVAAFNTCTALRLVHESHLRMRLDTVVCGGLTLLACMVVIVNSTVLVADQELRLRIAQVACTVIQLAMFAAPCLEATTACFSGDASRLSLPLAAATLVNGLMWTTYGLFQGNLSIWLPNATSMMLSLVVAMVKLCNRNRKKADDGAAHPLKKMLQEVTEQGTPVLLRSVARPEYHLHVGADDEPDPESESDTFPAIGTDTGTALTIVADGDEGQVAFKIGENAFLRICPKPRSMLGSAVQPSPWGVAAVKACTPGPEGCFFPVYGKSAETDTYEENSVFHNYGEDSVAFWNPLYRVFLRLNDRFEFDCSAEILATGDSGIYLPSGFSWERFVLKSPAEDRDLKVLRHRGATIGKSRESSGFPQ